MTAAPTRRVDRGRGHTYYLDGERADGVTWVLSNGIPKPALINWAAKEAARYAVDHWAELGEIPSLVERFDVIYKSRFEGRDAAAVRGTAVHDLAHRLAAGENVAVPDALVGHVDAYLAFVNDWRPIELIVERTIGNRQHGYMGTLDTIARLADGALWLLDWKTTASGVYMESALQLAAYRNAEFYLDDDNVEHPMPEVDRAGVVWLRADGYELVPVESTRPVFRAFLYAQQVARFTQQPRENLIGEALRRPEGDPA